MKDLYSIEANYDGGKEEIKAWRAKHCQRMLCEYNYRMRELDIANYVDGDEVAMSINPWTCKQHVETAVASTSPNRNYITITKRELRALEGEAILSFASELENNPALDIGQYARWYLHNIPSTADKSKLRRILMNRCSAEKYLRAVGRSKKRVHPVEHDGSSEVPLRNP